ncbi:hypothetical protein [Haloarchaeobius sp. DFWS5]|uniref:hypothetical protein n=1 Tax=Haloarchaeobius sp. DFWS5 TaxID=3446114 RepID=UPI003EBC7DA2
MGKTIPTYREQVADWESDVEEFQRALVYQNQQSFEEVVEHVHRVAHAAGYWYGPNHRETIMLSIDTCQQQEIRDLRERVDELEAALEVAEEDA